MRPWLLEATWPFVYRNNFKGAMIFLAILATHSNYYSVWGVKN